MDVRKRQSRRICGNNISASKSRTCWRKPWAFWFFALFPHFFWFLFFKQLNKYRQIQRYLNGKIISEDLDKLHLRLHYHTERSREFETFKTVPFYWRWASQRGHLYYLWTNAYPMVFSSVFTTSVNWDFFVLLFISKHIDIQDIILTEVSNMSKECPCYPSLPWYKGINICEMSPFIQQHLEKLRNIRRDATIDLIKTTSNPYVSL